MNYKLFSELILKERIKPDVYITNKIDELDYPINQIKFIKKDINNFIYSEYINFIELYRNIEKNNFDYFNEFNQTTVFKLDFVKNIELEIIKNKKECPPFNNIPKVDLDDSVLTLDFINEINKYLILNCLVYGLTFYNTLEFVKENSHLYKIQPRKITDELLSFWTNSFKLDFCYIKDLELTNKIIIEDREIEFGLLTFFYNYFKNSLIDYKHHNEEEKKFIHGMLEDKFNTKWFIIFGFCIVNRSYIKMKNDNESIFESVKKFRTMNYETLEKIFDKFIN